MKHNYVLSSADELIEVLQKMKETYPDRVFVTGVTTGGTVSAPTKKRAHYEHKLNHGFAPELFVGNGMQAIKDGGGFYIAHISKEHIDPLFLKNDQHGGGKV